MSAPLEFHIRSSNVVTRWSCYVCGYPTDKTETTIETDGDDPFPEFLCGWCLQDGVDRCRERMVGRAAELEAQAAELRQRAAGVLIFPPVDEWLAAIERECRGYDRAQPA